MSARIQGSLPSSSSSHSHLPILATKLRRADSAASPTPSTPAPGPGRTPTEEPPPTPAVRFASVSIADTDRADEKPRANGSINGQDGRSDEQRREAAKRAVEPDWEGVRARAVKRSRTLGRLMDDETAMVQTASRIAGALAADHRAVLVPDTETPFVDAVDVVRRLLPYHVFQQPQEDLQALFEAGHSIDSRKGKRKATEEELLREEIADTRFALECWKRRNALEKRFHRLKVQSGKRASPDDQAYVLAQAVLEAERAETASLNAELRSARAELEKIQREKKAAAAPPAAQPAPAARPTPYYAQTPASGTTTATFMPPYRPYSYSYAQPYGASQYTYNPHAYGATPYAATTAGSTNPYSAAAFHPAIAAATSAIKGATGTTAAATANATTNGTASAATNTTATSPTGSTPAAQTVTAAQLTAVQQALQQAKAVPLQLPVGSLPALAAIGIVPMAASSLVASNQTTPPHAVIKSTNGTTVNLEINLSRLSPSQMNGLALILAAMSKATATATNAEGSAQAATGGTGSAPLPASNSTAVPVTSAGAAAQAQPSEASTSAKGTG